MGHHSIRGRSEIWIVTPRQLTDVQLTRFVRRIRQSKGEPSSDRWAAIEADELALLPDRSAAVLIFNNAFRVKTDWHRAIGWAHPSLLRKLLLPISIFIDGTFTVVPRGFAQLLIVMGFLPDVSLYVPIAYILLTSKHKRAYLQAFSALNLAAGQNILPKDVCCDFEIGLIDAVKGTIT